MTQHAYTLQASQDGAGTLVAELPPLPFKYRVVCARAKVTTSAVVLTRMFGYRIRSGGVSTVAELYFGSMLTGLVHSGVCGENLPVSSVAGPTALQFAKTSPLPLGLILDDTMRFSLILGNSDPGDAMTEIVVVIQEIEGAGE